ncbi:MAG TPA: carboxypeptidase-like regulatory domain-containing protein [Thermoanaerobaculia bacterium]|nr:carboxypeptidase-like regulatory domain-containing protein [Thermoanaerobaculia bacterium]
MDLRRTRGVASLTAILALAGCASVSAHGVIRSPGGEPVPDATVTLNEPETGKLTARAESDLRGCFSVFEPVASGDRPYVLHVSAPGYRPFVLTVRMHDAPLLLVTLEKETSPSESASRPIAFHERYVVYDDACAPFGFGHF